MVSASHVPMLYPEEVSQKHMEADLLAVLAAFSYCCTRNGLMWLKKIAAKDEVGLRSKIFKESSLPVLEFLLWCGWIIN